MQSYRLRGLKDYHDQTMSRYLATEGAVRLILVAVFFLLECSEPVLRPIPVEQFWLYRYPHHDSTVSNLLLLTMSTFLPALFILVTYLKTRDKNDLIQGMLALTLCLCLNGVVTNVIKLSVGRPRPDFLFRCFPDGNIDSDLQCTGDRATIIQGRKSFPSGHSSFIFTGFVFVSLYLTSKLQCFSAEGRSHSWRLLAVILPLLSAAVVALSRVQDNRHHWEDVAVGALLGTVVTVLVYLHHFPSPFTPDTAIASNGATITPANSSALLPHASSASRLPVLTDVKTL